MSGSKILTEEEKQEMLFDARDKDRGSAFNAARMQSQRGNLDNYIDFLSNNMALGKWSPTRHVTDHYRL
jgi:hypothetical protein